MAIPLAVASYWLIDNLLIAAVLTCVDGEKFLERVVDLTRAESVIVLFGVAGGVGALAFREAGSALGLVTVAALLAVVDVKVLAVMALPALKRGTGNSHAVTVGYAGQLVLVAAMGVLGATHGDLLGAGAAVVGALVVTFLVALLGVHRRVGMWERHLALGVAIVDAPLVTVFAIAGALAVTVSIWCAIAVVSTALALSVLAARHRERKLARQAEDDERLAAAVELAVMDGRDWSSSSR
ncbi:MAG: hypothetical protein EXQ79_10365 [Acidimicrobiia bacterium]|nr:hypothetical protein [Acidimicrobiia bacterium]